ncbi:MAG: hypothetical protein HY954_02775 [Deltaproteobacteria bacterium]|nr:hypothetical protein [Deltaproteobacteria bacterium]
MKKALVPIFLFIFLAVSTLSLASDKREPTGGAMAFDIIFTRPLGIAAIVVGTALFVAALPFSLPTGSVGVTAEKLIGEPIEYTFKRPVGELDTNGVRAGGY